MEKKKIEVYFDEEERAFNDLCKQSENVKKLMGYDGFLQKFIMQSLQQYSLYEVTHFFGGDRFKENKEWLRKEIDASYEYLLKSKNKAREYIND